MQGSLEDGEMLRAAVTGRADLARRCRQVFIMRTGDDLSIPKSVQKLTASDITNLGKDKVNICGAQAT